MADTPARRLQTRKQAETTDRLRAELSMAPLVRPLILHRSDREGAR